MAVVEGSPDQNRVQEDVERLREWLYKQPHLRHDLEEGLLKAFVCGTKSLEIAKRKLDAWFRERGKLPNLFSYESRNPFTDKFKEASKGVKFYFLPQRAADGSAVFFHDIINMEYFDFHYFYVKQTMMIELMLKMWPEIPGLYEVYNAEAIDSSIITKLSPRETTALSQWFINTIPAKLKLSAIISAPSWVDKFMRNIVKPLINEKMYKRMMVTTEGKECLSKVLPVEILPMDYGGQEKHSDELEEYWQKKLEENADWYKTISLMVSDERKRPPDENNTYGIEGTFRSLSVD